MANINFPNVPDLPGVPPLARDPALPVDKGGSDITDQLLSDQPTDVLAPNVDFGPQWGILNDQGIFALVPDSIVAVEVKSDRDIATYPIEQGAFTSYNKVAKPMEIRVTMTCGGKLNMDRGIFLDVLELLRDSLELYSVVTVDKTYPSMNMTHFNYRRESSKGVSLLTVEAAFKEVRVTASASYTKTAQPQGQAQVNQGQTNAVAATPSQVQQAGGST